jgi:hypothetical protein
MQRMVLTFVPLLSVNVKYSLTRCEEPPVRVLYGYLHTWSLEAVKQLAYCFH